MKNKIQSLILAIFIPFVFINAQNKSISEINSFIKENSNGNKNYWSRLSLDNNNLLIYNTSRSNVGKYSFPINKIDANSIKATKKSIIIKSNIAGEHVSYMFGVERKESLAAILIFGMSKDNRNKLVELISSLVKELQNDKGLKNIKKDNIGNKPKLNKLLVNLFLNFELSNKNYNLSTIYSYIPDNIQEKIQQISFTSNLGHNSENIIFLYNNEGRLDKIKYSVDRKENKGFILFEYNLIYLNNSLKNINIKGKEKYKFEYSNNLITSVTLNNRGVQTIYNIEYDTENKKAYLNTDVNKEGKLYKFVNKDHKGKAKDFITWNENLMMTGYSIETYFSDNFTYDDKGNIESFEYSSVNTDDTPITWKYSFDTYGNWISQTNEKLIIERGITYQ